MKIVTLPVVLALFAVGGALPAQAQQSPQLMIPVAPSASTEEFTSRVLMLNQIKPAQNPQYRLGSAVLARRLLDQNRRTLGEVTDITLGDMGRLKSIEADVIATGFDQVLTFDVLAYNVTAESDAYSMTMTRDQLQDNLPDFMAGIETAAGDAGQPITIKSLIGGRVQTSAGSQFAVVDDVMIYEQGKIATALLLTLMKGSGRVTIAVPYADTKITRTGSKATVEVTEDQAKIISGYARKR